MIESGPYDVIVDRTDKRRDDGLDVRKEVCWWWYVETVVFSLVRVNGVLKYVF